MRKLVLTAATMMMASALVTAAAPRSYAGEGAWCAFVNSDNYPQDCSKRTLQICESESGLSGGSCSPNPSLRGQQARRGRQ